MLRMRTLLTGVGLLLSVPAGAATLDFEGPTTTCGAFVKTDCHLGGLIFSDPADNHGIVLAAEDKHAHNGTQVFENGNADLNITAANAGTFFLKGFDYGAGFFINEDHAPGGNVEVSFILTLADGTELLPIEKLATDDFQHIDFGGADGVEVKRLTITATNGGGWIALDNFTFEAGAAGSVPEPTSWALMLGGFGLVGGALRRRTRVAFA